MQASTSAFSSESNCRAKIESHRLFFDVKRETTQRELDLAKVEIEAKRAKIEEDREARLQRKEERESQVEEMRIEAQKAQTSMMMKMIETMNRKEH
jgi:hypothetical protein